MFSPKKLLPMTPAAFTKGLLCPASGCPKQPQSAFWLWQTQEVGWGHSPVGVGRAPGPQGPLCPKVLPSG